MYHITKKYYPNNCSNNCSNNNTHDTPFLKQVKLLISLYYKYNIQNFNNQYIKFYQSFNLYPNNKHNPSYIIIIRLLQIINNLYNLVTNLKDQISSYENDINPIYNNNNMELQKLDIVQNTSIDLVYMQYLLLFDIEETNGLFLENNLNIARQVLANNNRKLVYRDLI